MAAAITAAAAISTTAMKTKPKISYIEGLNGFSGLKAQNYVANLGMPACSDLSFAMVVKSLKKPVQGKRTGGGGALSSTCNATAEIFRIAAIMSGLVLVGVAVGFVLLRVEASIEEAE